MKTALVFGTFDCLHRGHLNLFEQIKSLGYNIIVCLAPDKIVIKRKGITPVQKFIKRKRTLELTNGIIQVIKGDLIEGEFSAINITRPNIIAIGYDQTDLELAIKKWIKHNQSDIPIIKLKAFKPGTYKSSLLRNAVNN